MVNPSLYPKLPYDPFKGFTPISGLVTINHALVVNPSFPVRNVKDLIALAKSKPGEINYGTFGIGCYGDVWKPSSDGTCIALEADDFDAEIARLQSRGVKFAMEPTPTPICKFAIIRDPDGNRILIHKRKKS